jgi:hypothetical protein
MKLVAPAPKPGLNFNITTRNVILALMCAVFMVWFFKDGWFGYPATNDRVVQAVSEASDTSTTTHILAKNWKGWSNESAESREEMTEALKKETGSQAGKIAQAWHQPFDVTLQRFLSVLLILVNVWSIGRLITFLRKRVECDDTTISPRRGVVVPWDKITCVDNTFWRGADIVQITYMDAEGKAQKADLDGYECDREKLIAILDQLAEKAVNAEFLPKEAPPEAAKESAGDQSVEVPKA